MADHGEFMTEQRRHSDTLKISFEKVPNAVIASDEKQSSAWKHKGFLDRRGALRLAMRTFAELP